MRITRCDFCHNVMYMSTSCVQNHHIFNKYVRRWTVLARSWILKRDIPPTEHHATPPELYKLLLCDIARRCNFAIRIRTNVFQNATGEIIFSFYGCSPSPCSSTNFRLLARKTYIVVQMSGLLAYSRDSRTFSAIEFFLSSFSLGAPRSV